MGSLWSAPAPEPALLSLGRVVLGFAVGGATQTGPMFVAELPPPRFRRAQARGVLERVRPPGYDVGPELDDIVGLARQEERAKTRGWSGLRAPWVRPALVVGCGIAIFTQLSGIEMIIYCSLTILTDSGFSTSTALRVSVALGVTYLVAQLVGLSIVDPVGRRRLTLLITLALLTMIEGIGVGPSMWVYAGFNVLAFLFVLRRMPELTDRSLEEIESRLGDGGFRPADFARR